MFLTIYLKEQRSTTKQQKLSLVWSWLKVQLIQNSLSLHKSNQATSNRLIDWTKTKQKLTFLWHLRTHYYNNFKLVFVENLLAKGEKIARFL